MTKILDALFDGHRQKVLGWLLLHPENSAHVRELARQIGAHPGSLHRELSRLAESGLIVRTVRGNQTHYQANPQSPIFPELASIFRKTSGVAETIRSVIEPLGHVVDVAFIYGSIARGTASANSDVDLFIVGTIPYAALVAALHASQSTLGREINPALYSPDEMQRKLADGDAFVTEVLANPKLFVRGSEDDVRQSGSYRQAGVPSA